MASLSACAFAGWALGNERRGDRTMTYVIKRSEDGAYVAPSGQRSSYVRALQYARTFSTRESAERERCPGNETIVSVEDEVRS